MIAMKKTLSSLLALGFGLAVASTSFAGDGLVVSKARLSEDARTKLGALITEERAAHADRFQALLAVVEKMPDVEKTARGRAPSISRALRALGKDAFVPLLEAVAFDGVSAGLTPKGRLGLEMSLVEALGALRDERALPVLVATAKAPGKDAWLRRVAAEAIGTLGTDAAVTQLIALSKDKDADPILLGMGECRRTKAAEHLRDVLDKKPGKETAIAVVGALGGVGNALAWTTSGVREHADEEDAVRETAMRALVRAFVAYDGEVRREASVALRTVAHKGTRDALVDAKKGASAATREAIEELIDRLPK